jgi:hypothetical protein
MRDEELDRIWTEYAGPVFRPKWVLPCLRAIASVAAAEERRSILDETGSTVTRACAALVRLSAPDDVDDAYVPRAAVVDIAMGLKRDMDALRSSAAAGGQGGGE